MFWSSIKVLFSGLKTNHFRILKNNFFWLDVPKDTFEEKFDFLQKAWSNPFGKFWIFGLFLKVFFLSVKTILSYLEYQKTIFLAFLPINYALEKVYFVWEKAWTNPFAKFRRFRLFWCWELSFLSRISNIDLLSLDFPKNSSDKKFYFLQKAWSKPFGNNNFSGFLEISFCQSKEHFFLLRTSS